MSTIFPVVPDRYENLERKAPDELETIVVPVKTALQQIDTVYARMRAAGRGAFLVLRGESGAGKSTFLHTISFYRDNVKTFSVRGDQNVQLYFKSVKIHHTGLQVHVL